ncbi:MAG: beta-glucosidase BglX [marine benthic group bacterium]|nr:beta-glucosidase BglX [Candidatus Carthagonibacter metallireducens]
MTQTTETDRQTEQRILELLARMTLEEKIGQLTLLNGAGGHVADELRHEIAAGRVGAVLNEVDVGTVNELQRIAVEESPSGIPLLIGRDVIHGFQTVFPLPLGQAASWNPELVERCARIAASEAAATGVNWTFAPMVDIGRDPRWGRIAETLGEDPWLASALAVAMVRGFEGNRLADPGCIAACAKHFAGYGASESGRDYNTTDIPEIELRNVHLPPFRAAVDAGVASLMTSFSDLNGVPATANEFLLKQVLREEWKFDGFVVSDWESVPQLAVHGLTADDRESALAAASAGLDMEMASVTFREHLAGLVDEGKITTRAIDAMAANVLRAKLRLGLFEEPYTDAERVRLPAEHEALEAAREAALGSLVLLMNRDRALPLSKQDIASLAVIGPMADEAVEQLGTWIFDGDPARSVTPLRALHGYLGPDVEVRYERALETTRSRSDAGFPAALEAARSSDAVVLFLGEESILSGEAHSRADIRLPGIQERLISELSATGKPIVLVVLAGRPLALEAVVDDVDAILYAWHPGSMAGPAIVDVLFGEESPSGKLPVTFPRVTGQIPIYYAHKNTGKPPTPETVVHIDDIPRDAEQLSAGGSSFHLDAGHTPLWPFGHGLSYTEFAYSNLRLSRDVIDLGDSLTIEVDVANVGERAAEEVTQLYVRDPVASVTRPVRELKGFRRVRLAPGETRTVSFELHTDDLAFHGRDMRCRTEPGRFHLWIGGSSMAYLRAEFEIGHPSKE